MLDRSSFVRHETDARTILTPVRVLVLFLALVGLLALTLAGSAAADVDPVTKHDTTFDDIAPRLSDGPGYEHDYNTTCTSPGTGYVDPQWRLAGLDDANTLE